MARMVGGTNVTITKDAAADTLTWAAANTSAGITDFAEAVDDRVAVLVVAGSGITKTYDDVANTLTLASSGMTNPMTTPADLIVGGTAGAPTRLAKGASGQVLTVDPTTGLLVWTTPTSGGMADPTTTKGDLLARNATAVTRLPVGADGQVLTAAAAEATGVKWAAGSGGAVENVHAVKRYVQWSKIPGTAAAAIVGATTTQYGNLGTGTAADTDDGPFLQFDTGATVGAGAGLQNSATWNQARRAWSPDLTIRFRLEQVTGMRAWCGLFSGSPLASATPALSLAAWRYDPAVDGTAFWRVVTDDGSGVPTVTVTTVPANTSTLTLGVQLDAASARFSHNGTFVATHTLTLPATSTPLGPAALVTHVTARSYVHVSRLTMYAY